MFESASDLSQQEAKIISQSVSDGLGTGDYIVGRESELQAIMERIQNAKSDLSRGSTVFVVGDNGRGKSKFIEAVANTVRDELGDIVSCFSISRERFFGTGTKELYCKFINNLSERTKRNGAGLETLLQAFIAKIQRTMGANSNIVEEGICKVLEATEGKEINTAFAQVIGLYINSVSSGNASLRQNTLKWIKGEYQQVRDARADLGNKVDFIISDKTAIAMLKNWINLFSYIDKTTFLAIDEIQSLERLDDQPLQRNWDVIKDLYDASQKMKLVLIFTGTKKELLDKRKGLFSNRHLGSRLGGQPINDNALADPHQALFELKAISDPNILIGYLDYLSDVRNIAVGRELPVSGEDKKAFLQMMKAKEVGGCSNNEINVAIRTIGQEFERKLSLLESGQYSSFAEACGFSPKEMSTTKTESEIKIL